MERLGRGVYAIAEAAHLAMISPTTARRWFLGRPDSPAGPVLRPDYDQVGESVAVSFLDLVDLLVVGRFREQRVSLQTVRKVYHKLKQTLGQVHPFGHRKLLTDGRAVFLETLDNIGDRHLEEILTGQRAFPEVLKRYLREVEYSPDTGIAQRWRISQGIVLDPTRNFGKPTVDAFGICTAGLAAAYSANAENAELVADLYGVTPGAVMDAVRFEHKTAA